MRLRGSNHGGRGIEGRDVVTRETESQRITPGSGPRVEDACWTLGP